MIKRKYIVQVTMAGVIYALIIYASTCDLTYSQISYIAKRDFNPACEVLAYKLEPPEIPGNGQLTPDPIGIGISVSTSGTPASGVSPSYSYSAEDMAS